MYSRYGDKSNRPVRLPEHYGGSTFSQEPTNPITIPQREPPRPFPRDGVGEKASPIADRLLRAETVEKEDLDAAPLPEPVDEEIVERKEEEKKPLPPTEKPMGASPFNFSALRRLFGGKDGDGEEQDRLLLLGLILLLSRTEGDSDVLLWLSLLLLCG